MIYFLDLQRRTMTWAKTCIRIAAQWLWCGMIASGLIEEERLVILTFHSLWRICLNLDVLLRLSHLLATLPDFHLLFSVWPAGAKFLEIIFTTVSVSRSLDKEKTYNLASYRAQTCIVSTFAECSMHSHVVSTHVVFLKPLFMTVPLSTYER